MAKIFGYKRDLPCYFCGSNEGINKEHVPPDMLFDGIECDRLTVPACQAHNGEKTSRDFAILISMVRCIDQGLSGPGPMPRITPNIARFIERRRRRYHNAKKTVTVRPFLREAPPALRIETSHADPSLRTDEWMLWLTAALTWTATETHLSGSDWDSAMLFCPDRFDSNISVPEFVQTKKEIDETSRWFESFGVYLPGWQPIRPYPPDLYRFKVALIADGACFKHTFFNELTWYVVFQTSPETMRSIHDLLL